MFFKRIDAVVETGADVTPEPERAFWETEDGCGVRINDKEFYRGTQFTLFGQGFVIFHLHVDDYLRVYARVSQGVLDLSRWGALCNILDYPEDNDYMDAFGRYNYVEQWISQNDIQNNMDTYSGLPRAYKLKPPVAGSSSGGEDNFVEGMVVGALFF